MVGFFLFSCSAPVSETPIAQMDDYMLLRRLSIDIRGVLPTEDEYEQLEHRVALDFVDDFLYDPLFGDRVRSIFADYYRTEVDTYSVSGSDFAVISEAAFREAVGQEALRIVQQVAQEDMPWTEIVTGDWTMANEVSAQIFSIAYDGPGWQKAQYSDGRPAAGILATSGIWLRYTSTISNANRNRANTISRILLCNNYLHRPIRFERGLDLLDQEAVDEAISNNTSCVGCHQTLDPLAAHLFGFWSIQNTSTLEASTYHPDRERFYTQFLGVEPAYYGSSSYGLGQLGTHIANDERFSSCAVEQVSEQLLGRKYELSDIAWSTPHRNAFIESGLQLRALIRSIVHDPFYRVAWYEENTQGSNAKLMKPSQLTSVIAHKTGFVWEYQDDEIFDNNVQGIKQLAGGGTVFVEPSATYILSLNRLVEQAAIHVALTEQEQDVEDREFFIEVSSEQLLDVDQEASIRMLQRWHMTLLGREVALDGEQIAANIALWNTLYDINSNPTEAWVGVLTALFRDPDFVLY